MVRRRFRLPGQVPEALLDNGAGCAFTPRPRNSNPLVGIWFEVRAAAIVGRRGLVWFDIETGVAYIRERWLGDDSRRPFRGSS